MTKNETARRFAWRFVRGSEDKPHRCPKCWGLIAYPFARWWKIYGCRKCKVVWWKGIHD